MLRPIRQIVLSLTGECNFDCSYCYASEQAKDYLSPTQAVKTVELVLKHNNLLAKEAPIPFILQFSGGEPLLNWQAIEAVTEYINKNNIPAQLQLQTNGALLDDYKARFLYQNNIGIGVSLDGRPKDNDKQRFCKDGTSAALTAINGLQVLKRNNIACGITCVITEENVAGLEGLVELAYYLGNVRKIGFDLLRPQGRGGCLKPAPPELLEKYLNKAYSKAKALQQVLGFGISFSFLEKCFSREASSKKFRHCSAMSGEALFVDARGYLYGCASFIGDEQFSLGSLENGIAIEKAERLKSFIENVMGYCQSCQEFEVCGGGCLARWYDKNLEQEYKSECVLKRSARNIKRLP